MDTKPANIGALIDKLSSVTPPAQGSRAAAIVRAATQPVFESPYREKMRAVGITGEQPLQRVGSESSDTTRLFPAVTAQVPKVWIGWYINRSIDASTSMPRLWADISRRFCGKQPRACSPMTTRQRSSRIGSLNQAHPRRPGFLLASSPPLTALSLEPQAAGCHTCHLRQSASELRRM